MSGQARTYEMQTMRIFDSNPTPPAPDPDDMPGPDAPLIDRVKAAIRGVYDPEIPINIYDLGLIYGVELDDDTKKVGVTMTLTTPNCPEAQTLPLYVKQAVEAIPEVSEATVEITWDPPWDKDKMSDEAKFQLGLM